MVKAEIPTEAGISQSATEGTGGAREIWQTHVIIYLLSKG